MYSPESSNSAQKTVATLIIIVAVIFISVSVKAYDNKSKTSTTLTTPKTIASNTAQAINTNSAPNSTAAASTSGYKDGTYSASADYYVPHGSESIAVSLTIKGGVVTDSSVQNSESNPESAAFQEDFTAIYKDFVIGKNVSKLRLTYVAGASDTTNGFNYALRQIQNQAKA